MTEAERKEAYEVRVELRERRREEGNTRGRSNFVIHRGRVINKTENGREARTPRDGSPQNEQTNNRPDTDSTAEDGEEEDAE